MVTTSSPSSAPMRRLSSLRRWRRSASGSTLPETAKGHHGFVTDVLQKLIDEGQQIDFVIAVGPIPMMKAVADLTRKYEIKTIVSLNSMMVDGTGMCGGCRVTVGGEVKFTCVDGPSFDAHLLDFDEQMRRLSMYKDMEKLAEVEE